VGSIPGRKDRHVFISGEENLLDFLTLKKSFVIKNSRKKTGAKHD
jgi:hypothetical protein